ncbi:MAG TPA: GPR1/FUN34/YaaH family transporter [Rhodanobacteraceae bacterium]
MLLRHPIPIQIVTLRRATCGVKPPIGRSAHGATGPLGKSFFEIGDRCRIRGGADPGARAEEGMAIARVTECSKNQPSKLPECWQQVNFYLWIATLRGNHPGLAVSAVGLLIWVAFLLLGLRIFFNLWVLVCAGGAVGPAAALVAFYASFGALASEHCPGIKLPGIGRKPEALAPASPAP